MKYVFHFLSLFFILTSCNLKEQPVITMDKFHEVNLGSTTAQITEYFGTPVRIHEQQSGELIYEYFERFPIAPSRHENILEVRRYYFIFENGILKNKFYKVKTEPLFHEYDGGTMQ